MRSVLRLVPALLALAVVMGCLVVYRTLQSGRGEAEPVSAEVLNPRGEFQGPEGIAFDSRGVLFVGDARGRIWRFDNRGRPSIFVELDHMEPPAGIQAGGMAFDSQGNLYVAAFGFAGGSILQVDPARRIRFFARDLGVANNLVITGDSRHLWVSDYRGDGRLLRYPLGGTLPGQPDAIISGLRHPNGLVFGKSEQTLFAAETFAGNIVKLDLRKPDAQPERVVNLKGTLSVGSLDGLAFDPRDGERRFLYVAENLRGLVSVVDLAGNPPRVVRRLGMGLSGIRPCPASLVIRDGYLYFTDLWECSPIDLLLGKPKWHQSVTRFRVTDLSSLF
jgi:sugar lactone lactonase YvrE